MGDEKPAPLTEKEVKESAKRLEKIADEFLDKNQEAAFDKWHMELRQVAKHGVPSTKQVLRQIQLDSSLTGPAAKAQANEADYSAAITIQPNRFSRMFGNRDYIGGNVDQVQILSAAKTRAGKHFAEITIQTNLSNNPFELNPRKYDPFELFPLRGSALDIAPKPKLDWTRLADSPLPVKK